MKRLGPPTTPIGLDLGALTIRAAQRDLTGGVLALASVRRDAPDSPYSTRDFERLQGVLYRRGFRGRDLIIAAPKSIIQRTSIELPPKQSGAPIEQIARSELARQTHEQPDAFEFAWWNAPQPPRHGASTRAIAVSIPHAKADALLDAAESIGLNPLALFSPSTAFAAAVPPPEPGATSGVLDLGWTDATLVVLNDSEIIFERQLGGCGLAEITLETARKRNIDPARLTRMLEHTAHDDAEPIPIVADLIEAYTDVLCAEMGSSIDYLRGCEGSPDPVSVAILGGGASLPGLAERVSQAAEIPVHVAPCPHGPASATALGLASSRGRFMTEEAA